MTIQFKTENEAFSEENFEKECARILRKISTQVAGGDVYGPILDINGNKIGDWSF